ncbi:YlaN family protein [Sporolactobacillus vineae]|uniref:YlaN family protein n=1 Tax=Sporolactobacillus vineae TaxID=444463 RepID=UPI00028946A1|nr:YlaN family protein [Sporolactobacillus vineae]
MNLTIGKRERAYELLQSDARKILKLIGVQMENLTIPKCPLYEEVLDTQMFGLSREIDFAVRMGLVRADDGRELLSSLERQVSALHEASMRK